MKNFFRAIVLAMLVPVAACNAQSNETLGNQFVEGKDYTLLARPVATADPSKIEVTEIFWYGCIHCFNIEKDLEEWVPELPEDVNFVRLPAIWADIMQLHASVYYASEALGLTEQLHRPIFDAMNTGIKNQMPSEEAILNFVEDEGVDREKFRRALNSFGVSSQVQQARAKMGAYGVRGTPEMVVNGKYKLTTTMSGSHARMLQIADELIAKERAAMAAQ